jgi:hypothetical protein
MMERGRKFIHVIEQLSKISNTSNRDSVRKGDRLCKNGFVKPFIHQN